MGDAVRSNGCGGIGCGSKCGLWIRAFEFEERTECDARRVADSARWCGDFGGGKCGRNDARRVPDADLHGDWHCVATERTRAILLLEDRGMKPWQVDRALTHLRQSGSLDGVNAILLGEFPECEGPAGTETVRDVAARILTPLGIPVVWGAAVGHSARAMVTVPLGVRGRIEASGKPALEVLEPACRES